MALKYGFIESFGFVNVLPLLGIEFLPLGKYVFGISIATIKMTGINSGLIFARIVICILNDVLP